MFAWSLLPDIPRQRVSKRDTSLRGLLRLYDWWMLLDRCPERPRCKHIMYSSTRNMYSHHALPATCIHAVWLCACKCIVASVRFKDVDYAHCLTRVAALALQALTSPFPPPTLKENLAPSSWQIKLACIPKCYQHS